MSDKIVIYRRGLSFSGFLGLLFIALKLMGEIDWSWIWVLSPLWIPFALGGVLFVVGVGFAFAIALLMDLSKKVRRRRG